jgi:uncharacterized membrane protein
MPIGTISLLALAAVIHGTWNLLSKRSVEKQVYLWLALVASLVIFLVPMIAVVQPLAPHGWVFIVLSGLLEAVYYLLLGSAYQRGDLSLVYPLARGSAPLFATLFAVVLLGERPTLIGLVGILVIVSGIYTLHLKSLTPRGLAAPLLALRDRTSQLAVLVGLTIASYSVVDKQGVRAVSPFPYLYFVLLVAATALAPYMLLARRQAVRDEWRSNWLSILLTAVLFVASYLLVLIALSGSQVSYVASVREMSIVFGALLGALVLREPFGRTKILGAALIFAGIVAIAVG